MIRAATIRSSLRALVFASALVGTVALWIVVPRWAEARLAATIAEAAARDPEREALKGRVVVLDAGHGGQDSGTAGNGVQEKTATLDLARRVEKQLRQQGINVRMTRELDAYLELEERCAVAKKCGASAFVSLHLNASSARGVAGIETYFCSQRTRLTPLAGAEDQRSELLASSIQRHACQATGAPDRGVRDSRLYVVQHAPCPAVLVECGYLTNADEARHLQREAYKERLATAVAEGIRRYLIATSINPRRGFSAPAAASNVAARGS